LTHLKNGLKNRSFSLKNGAGTIDNYWILPYYWERSQLFFELPR
jgi:hypothetical protein